MMQEGLPFIPKGSLGRKKPIRNPSQHPSQHPSQLNPVPKFPRHNLDEPSNPAYSEHRSNGATDTLPPITPQRHVDEAAESSSNSSERQSDSIQEAMEDIWAHDEFVSTQRAAAGAILPDAQSQAKTLTNLKDWQAAVTLSTAMTTNAATFQERYWEKRVRSLEAMTHVWRAKWDGIHYWDEKRVPYRDGTMSHMDVQDYLSHVEFGRDLLDGCRSLFSPEEVDPPEAVERVVHLFRRVMAISVEVSLGLERLGYSKQ
jgi:hypothetical protein